MDFKCHMLRNCSKFAFCASGALYGFEVIIIIEQTLLDSILLLLSLVKEDFFTLVIIV